MSKFRKKPVVIDAVQLTWANWNAICDFVPKPWFVRGVYLHEDGTPMPENAYRFEKSDEMPNSALGLIMQTLESQEFLAQGNDWIIKGVNGEFYPCKPDIFEKTYDPA
jgi:hypothetical protein